MGDTYAVRHARAAYGYEPRERRLAIADRRQRGRVEKEPELLPVICGSCSSVIGLVEPDQELYCHDCRTWTAPDDAMLEMLA
jgi:hypothetical protein